VSSKFQIHGSPTLSISYKAHCTFASLKKVIIGVLRSMIYVQMLKSGLERFGNTNLPTFFFFFLMHEKCPIFESYKMHLNDRLPDS